MHWKGGHFEAPVTIDETLFITEHKHYAIRGIVDKTIFGDNSVNTEIIGKNINEISQGYYKVDAGTSVEINAKNGTGTLKSTGNINISSSGAKVNINGKTGITVGSYSYGTGLPGSGSEGEIFFKLIS